MRTNYDSQRRAAHRGNCEEYAIQSEGASFLDGGGHLQRMLVRTERCGAAAALKRLIIVASCSYVGIGSG
jgi:hypothetical protein